MFQIRTSGGKILNHYIPPLCMPQWMRPLQPSDPSQQAGGHQLTAHPSHKRTPGNQHLKPN